jgi:Tannase and feruloyl esterase
LQPQFGRINSDKPDLRAFKRRGGKLLTWHGMADEVIPSQGTVYYYNRAARAMGGMANLRSFYRLYLVPGLGHGTPNGTSNPAAIIPNFAPGQIYGLMTAWVEKAAPPPGPVILKAGEGSATRSMPVCPYPEAITYVAGSPRDASSYACSEFKGKSAQR